MRYLIQKRKGQRDHIYEWTETLAAKADMFPISEEDAKKILHEQKNAGQRVIEAKPDVDKVVVTAAKKERIDMADIVGDTEKNEDPDDVQNPEELDDVTQYNPDKDPVIIKAFSLKTKNAMEGFALEKGFKLKRTKTTRLKDMQNEFAQMHILKMTELLQEG